jgi:hypothetical protein
MVVSLCEAGHGDATDTTTSLDEWREGAAVGRVAPRIPSDSDIEIDVTLRSNLAPHVVRRMSETVDHGWLPLQPGIVIRG